MPIWHGERGRKRTGGKVNLYRGKKKYELGSNPLMTKIGKERVIKVRTKGGNEKIRTVSTQKANVYDPSTKKTKQVKITGVVSNPANPHFVRRAIITKGATIETELGLAKITSRPSQQGVVNAVALEKEKS